FNSCVLRRDHFRDCNPGTLLWPTHSQGLCRSSGTCSVLSNHVGCNLPARITLIDEPLELRFLRLMRQFLCTKADILISSNFRRRKRATCLAVQLATFRQTMCS